MLVDWPLKKSTFQRKKCAVPPQVMQQLKKDSWERSASQWWRTLAPLTTGATLLMAAVLNCMPDLLSNLTLCRARQFDESQLPISGGWCQARTEMCAGYLSDGAKGFLFWVGSIGISGFHTHPDIWGPVETIARETKTSGSWFWINRDHYDPLYEPLLTTDLQACAWLVFPEFFVYPTILIFFIGWPTTKCRFPIRLKATWGCSRGYYWVQPRWF